MKFSLRIKKRESESLRMMFTGLMDIRIFLKKWETRAVTWLCGRD